MQQSYGLKEVCEKAFNYCRLRKVNGEKKSKLNTMYNFELAKSKITLKYLPY